MNDNTNVKGMRIYKNVTSEQCDECNGRVRFRLLGF